MTPERPAPSPAPPRRPSPAQVVLGLVLVAVGVAWLLQAVAGADVRWDLLVPLTLMLVGGGVIAGARHRAEGGLIGVGVVLTLLLAVASSVGGLGDVPFVGGVDDRVERPESLTGDVSYRLAVGELEVDLTATALPAAGTVEVTASVAIGRLVVRLPEGTAVRVKARASAGSVRVLDQAEEGLDARLVTEDGSNPRLLLDLSAGLGEVVVER